MNPSAPSLSRVQVAADRKARSMAWRVIYALGSLKLAMTLLGVLALACIAATVWESRLSTKVAAHYVYNAPWFQLWLAVLCINLIAVTLTRWPWERRHVGFVVTHYGIVTLLVGSVIGHFAGFEGTVTLNKGEPGERIVIDQTLLYVQPEATGDIFTTPYDPSVRVPSEERTRRVPLPGGAGEMVISGYSESLVQEKSLVPAAEGQGSPGVALTLVTAMTPQPVTVQLVREPEASSTFDMFGRGRVEWRAALPPAPAPPATNVPTFRETQIVLAQHPGQPVADNTTGKLCGYRFALLPADKPGEFKVGIVTPSGRELVRPMAELFQKPFRWDELDVIISVQELWLDFAMKDGRPVSASNEPRNPAMLVHITGVVDARNGNIERVLQLAPAHDGGLAYRSLRGGIVVAEGTAKVGESFRVGWADWQAQVKTLLPVAKLVDRFEPSSTTAVAPAAGRMGGVPGLRVALRPKSGAAGEAVWLPQGTSQLLNAGGEFFRIGFGLKTLPLGFRVTLNEFKVPRQPGTQEPADFISRVTFLRERDGVTHSGEIKMNDPESFPPDVWRGFTGMNYKFSQAGWDPNQLDQTTLQVLHDPGWLFKWLGSLGICAGIAIMFYWKPGQRAGSAARDGLTTGASRLALTCLLLAGLWGGGISSAQAAEAATTLSPTELETLPVQHRGRVKPFLAFSRETLTSLYGRASWQEDGEKLTEMQVVTGLWLQPGSWQTKPLILVEFGPLREALGLAPQKKRFSVKELAASAPLQDILTSARNAPRVGGAEPELTPLQNAARKVADRLERSVDLFSGSAFTVLPHRARAADGSESDAWQPLNRETAGGTPGAEAFQKLKASWPGDAAGFSKAATLLRSEVERQAAVVGTPLNRIALEHTYLRLHPFQWSYVCCFAAVAVMALAPLLPRALGYGLVWTLGLAAFAAQVAGIAMRVMISGRPPVTNMYETVIWLATGVMLFALLLEAIFRCRYYLFSALPVAGIALILADLSPAVLDSAINPLVPVLRDNFWLTIHVLTVTSSYAAFALALVVGHVALWQVCFRGGRNTAAIYQYLYRAMQIGVLLLAVGTILGGVWANYSWGRFWGWDPKETWALISLLGYLFLLHGRITGWWGGFGLAVGSVVCFQLVLMTWYGVNFILGTGLHSYGRGAGGAGVMVAYLIGEAVFLTLALWRKRAFHSA